jgi:hypothetical protein
MLQNPVSFVLQKLSHFSYFQNVGLNKMLAADTVKLR